MFWKTRKRLDDIERAIASLAEKLERPPASPDASAIFASLLGKQLENQGDLVTAFGEIAVKASARRAGIKGGTKRASTAERTASGRFLPKREREPACELCRDPMTRNVTVAMIMAHRAHEVARQRNGTAHTHPVEPTTTEPPDDPDSNGGNPAT